MPPKSTDPSRVFKGNGSFYTMSKKWGWEEEDIGQTRDAPLDVALLLPSFRSEMMLHAICARLNRTLAVAVVPRPFYGTVHMELNNVAAQGPISVEQKSGDEKRKTLNRQETCLSL